MTRILALLGLLLLIAFGAAMAWTDPATVGSGPGADAPPQQVAGGDTNPDEAKPDPRSGVKYLNEFAIDESSLTPEQRADTIVLGNGWRVWALNGCKNTEKLAWSASRSKAPIKRLVHGDKFDYYEHEDGAVTTTQLIRDLRTGEYGASPQHWAPVNLDGVKFDSGTARPEHRMPNAPVRQRPTRRTR